LFLFISGEKDVSQIHCNFTRARRAVERLRDERSADRGTRANTDALARLETRLARLERTSAEQAAELRLRNAA